VVAEISKEHADNLYGKKLFEEAMVQYIDTIGFLNPSYVIHKYIEVHKLPFLIKYLEKLINTPDTRQNTQSLVDYNKDYTALLLNCYVKTENKAKVAELVEKAKTGKLFDVTTAIEVCRQQEDTLEQAEQMAEYQKKWKLLVQIKAENKKEYAQAMEIIDQRISNLKEKVTCLQIYGPKLLKQKDWLQDKFREIESVESPQDKIMRIVKEVAKALIEHKKIGRFSKEFQHFELKNMQKIRLEELLKIFVDDTDKCKEFL